MVFAGACFKISRNTGYRSITIGGFSGLKLSLQVLAFTWSHPLSQVVATGANDAGG